MKAKKGQETRRAARHDVSLRVRSRKLPGFRALTHDMSSSGLQLEAEGEIAVGLVLDLTLEFDVAELAEMTVPGRIVWCRPETRNRCRAGVQFLADQPGLQKRLEYVAAVLQSRSEADLETLLGEAKRLDEDRSQQVLRTGPRARLGTHRINRLTGVVIPLTVVLQAYSWDLDGTRLWLALRENTIDHMLAFPACHLVRDHGCSSGKTACNLHSATGSELVDEVVRRVGPGPWKHYQFLAEDEHILLEIVSHPCQSG